MRVLVDAHMLGHRETGNETYVRGLLAGLASLDGVTVGAAVQPGYQAESGLPKSIAWLPLPTTSNVRRLSGDLGGLGQKWKADVLHATYLAPYRSHCPVVISVHDVSFQRYPEYFSWRDRALFSTLLPSSLRRASAILTLSGHARDELRHFYPALRTPIHVVPAAASDIYRPVSVDPTSGVLSRLELRRPFFLAVGSVQPRKNLVRLVEAFHGLGQVRSAVELVVVGPNGFDASTLAEAIASRGLTNAVRLVGYVPQAELVALYNAAIALVYPSVYEGFGLPVVEAMACGRPVIAANTSSLPEVAGDAALLVDPFSTTALRAAMERLLTNPRAAADLGQRGLQRVRQFSWPRTAASAMAAFQAACGASAPSS